MWRTVAYVGSVAVALVLPLTMAGPRAETRVRQCPLAPDLEVPHIRSVRLPFVRSVRLEPDRACVSGLSRTRSAPLCRSVRPQPDHLGRSETASRISARE